MSRWEPRKGLDVAIAKKFGIPLVRRAVDMLEDEAKRNAPPVKVWVTMRDERVRPSHVEADTQAVPENIPFKLTSANGGTDLCDHPRDPNLPIEQRIHCRCDDSTRLPLLRDSIHATTVRISGTRVTGSVETRFPRAAESEYTDGGHYMSRALREVAARLKAGHAR